jgi:regulator of protease activity HflC (stomatin/prohibitin superfamily)
MNREKETQTLHGVATLLFLLAAAGASLVGAAVAAQEEAGAMVGLAVLAATASFLALTGLFKVDPNEAKVLQLFGRYVGTVRTPGLRWSNPFYSKTSLSLRVRNFETSKLKVNDSHGNPIEIAAVVVWKVVDTAEAMFEVDSYEHYVRVQSEAAVRNLATSYPYDAHQDGELSLVGSLQQVSDRLKEENQNRLEKAGIEIIESRISHLAYAPEIAQAMLRRQQAGAIIAARRQIVEGAVGMVEHALDELRLKNVVELDEERKAAMVSNLLVVLCSESETQPIVNAGSLY